MTQRRAAWPASGSAAPALIGPVRAAAGGRTLREAPSVSILAVGVERTPDATRKEEARAENQRFGVGESTERMVRHGSLLASASGRFCR